MTIIAPELTNVKYIDFIKGIRFYYYDGLTKVTTETLSILFPFEIVSINSAIVDPVVSISSNTSKCLAFIGLSR